MRRRRALALVPFGLAVLAPGVAAGEPAPAGSGTGTKAAAVAESQRVDPAAVQVQTTAWRDDFNRLDPAVWRTIDGWGCKSAANVTTSGGHLRLKTTTTGGAECPLLGARVDTYGRRHFSPGTFTARIRFAPRTGSWQTFLLTGGSGKAFPANGEVDIAEILGRTPATHYIRAHAARETDATSRCTQKAASQRPVGFLSDWHVFSATTSARRVVFRVDGTVVASFAPNGTCTFPFGDPMRVLFSVGGGTWAGPPNAAAFPQTVLVDWFSFRPN